MMTKKALIQTDHLLSLPVELPVPGQVRVHLGQSVEPGDVIAEAILPARFQVFDVINQFRIKDNELDSCIKRLAGEQVQRGDVVAKKPGLISRLFRAPDDGKVVAIRDGRLTLALGERTIQAMTPIAGTVGEVNPGLGAVIVSRGLSLQGGWGNGLTAIGKLLILIKVNEVSLAETKEAIVFLDGMASVADLIALQNAGAAGILATALDPLSLAGLKEIKLALMSLVGFGDTLLDSLSRAVIEELQGSQVYLVARTADPYANLRPELFKPGENGQTVELFPEPEPSLIGRTVRLLGQPYFGTIGKIVGIPPEIDRLASGMESHVTMVEREDETVIRVPLENLEILTT